MKTIVTQKQRRKLIVFLSISAGGLATFFTILSGLFDSINFFSSTSNAQDVSGTWIVRNEVKFSDKKSYIGTKNVFKLFLQQDNLTIYGDGEKIGLNSQSLPYDDRVRIEVQGRLYGDSIVLNFKEFGLRRTTVGSIHWAVAQNGLIGRFSSTAASSTGISLAEKFIQ